MKEMFQLCFSKGKEKNLATCWFSTCYKCFRCTPAGGRTLDTQIKSQVLYQLSYGSIVLWVQNYTLFQYNGQILQTFFITLIKTLYINYLHVYQKPILFLQ